MNTAPALAGVVRDLAYGTELLQKLDVYAPSSASKNMPVIVYVHGGSWQFGDKKHVAHKPGFFNQNGYIFVSVEYRKVPDVTVDVMAADIARAVTWLKQNIARYNGNPEKLILMGHSAGAHLVSLVGTNERFIKQSGGSLDDIAGVISLDTGAYDVERQIESAKGNYGEMLGRVFGSNPELWRDVSPVHHIGAKTPPFYLASFRGRPDLKSQGGAFLKRLEGAGIKTDYMIVENRTHESLNQQLGSGSDPLGTGILTFLGGLEQSPKNISAPEKNSEAKNSSNWRRIFDAPQTDADGDRLTGTEIIDIVTHNGKLFAGNSYWNETTEPRQGQVFRLDSPHGQWQLDLQMPRRYSRVAALKSVTFKTDGQGKAISGTEMLIAGATYDKGKNKPGFAGLFVRAGAEKNWIKTDLGTTDHPFAYTQVRSLGFYRDKMTGVDMVFAGANPAPLGVFTGTYNSNRQTIEWNAQPEFTPQGYQRIMGFSSCAGSFYMATQREIYRRIDGVNPRWEQVMDITRHPQAAKMARGLHEYWRKDDDIRAFDCISYQGAEALLFGYLNHMLRFDPRNKTLSIEQSLPNLVKQQTGYDAHYVQTQDLILLEDGSSLIGIEMMFEPAFIQGNMNIPHLGAQTKIGVYAAFAAQGFYLVRTDSAGRVSYRLQEIHDPAINPAKSPWARVRTLHPSPFAQEQGVIYAGGFAPWFKDVTNTAWIAKSMPEAVYKR